MFARQSLVISVVTEPKRKIREVIYARVRMGKCIAHTAGHDPTSPEDAAFCDKDARACGVCVAHYQHHGRSTANLSKVKASEITDALVQEGQFLRPQTIHEIKSDSPIRQIAKQVAESK